MFERLTNRFRDIALLLPLLWPCVATAQIDRSPLPVALERAFPALEFDRPIVLTHAGDGSNRVFIVSQLGKIFVLPNDQDAVEVTTFLDLSHKVAYKDIENEEGLLGLAFHPHFAENGELFIYYSTREAPHTSIVSRFRLAGDGSGKVDPASEEELLRVSKLFFNHNGGTVLFGPDGYLYIALGDGGSANDPQGNGQNLGTLLGSILRIDVDHKDPGKKYAIPHDNPFVNQRGARPEIWAYGLRNVWRMAFDRKTGLFWAGDVGQDNWEEIDLLIRGGNYGWNLREGRHPFGRNGVGPRVDLMDPIWEYHHTVGKSIIGGCVYRGRRVPALVGCYLYADYVTGQIWALRYDERQKRVVANHTVGANTLPILSFGEDEQGDVYFLTQSGPLGWIHRFAPTPAP